MSHTRATQIKEGDHVEVINYGSGMEYSYYGVKVISLVHRGRCTVRYTYLMKEDDKDTYLEEEVPLAMLRPFPEAIPQWDYFHGEIANGWFNDGWWLGRIVTKVNNQYVVRYEDRSQHAHGFQDVHLHQEWNHGVWMYSKLNKDYQASK